MVRKALTIFSLIGLLLSIGLWGASYFNVTYLAIPVKSLLHLTEGRLGWMPYAKAEFPVDAYGREAVVLKMYPPSSVGVYKHALINQKRRWYCEGYRGLKTRFGPSARSAPMMLWIPLWIPGLIFGVILFLCSPVRHHRRRKRKKLGLCLKCGYDLRGSKEQCPECGTGFS